jgi:saccharopine dehydrogenase-like NADP-dependent oxidoreductase
MHHITVVGEEHSVGVEESSARTGDVLIVGGYGQVGQVVARNIAPWFTDRVIVAGRSQTRADALAEDIGHGVRGRAFDITRDGAALDLRSVAWVVVCIDQENSSFAARCLASGVNYIDITARDSSIGALERLDSLARKNRSTGILSVGVCPGLTNLLAAYAAHQFDTITQANLFVMFGSGDSHGQAAIEWTLDNLGRRFPVFQNGELHEVRSFGEYQNVHFPGDSRQRRAYRFNFPDQRTIARTLSIPTASTWLCSDSASLTGFMRLLSTLTRSDGQLHPAIRGAVLRAVKMLRLGSDRVHLMVRAEGQVGERRVVRAFGFSGRGEAELTGLVTAETLRLLSSTPQRAGVFHLEQIMDAHSFLQRIQHSQPEARLWL